MTRTASTSFYISGAFVTNHARQLCEEGAWQDALTFLMESLEGMTTEIAVSVLSGDKILVGDSRIGVETIGIAADDPARLAYLTQIRWLYAGTVRERIDRLYYWKPYARVTGWGPFDLAAGAIFKNRWHSRERMPVGVYSYEASLDWGLSRSCRYMDDQQLDKGVVLPYKDDRKGQVILWKEVGTPPLWWRPKNQFKDGLAEYLSVHSSLEERGAHVRPWREDILSTPPPKPEPAPQPRLNEWIESTANVSREFDTESPPIVGSPKADYGYIDRDGKFYPCQYFEHSSLAMRVVKHLMGNKEGDPERLLDDGGWIRCTISAITGEPSIIIRPGRHATDAQKVTAVDWCLHHGKDIKHVDFLALET